MSTTGKTLTRKIPGSKPLPEKWLSHCLPVSSFWASLWCLAPYTPHCWCCPVPWALQSPPAFSPLHSTLLSVLTCWTPFRTRFRLLRKLRQRFNTNSTSKVFSRNFLALAQVLLPAWTPSRKKSHYKIPDNYTQYLLSFINTQLQTRSPNEVKEVLLEENHLP